MECRAQRQPSRWRRMPWSSSAGKTSCINILQKRSSL